MRTYIFGLVWALLGVITIGFVGAQTKDQPPVTTQEGYTHGNCELLQIKYLQAATQETDLTQQQLELNAAKAYGEIATLGYIC